MLSLGWNVITRAAPSWWHVNLGTTYLNVPLATVHHLYNVRASVSGLLRPFLSCGFYPLILHSFIHSRGTVILHAKRVGGATYGATGSLTPVPNSNHSPVRCRKSGPAAPTAALLLCSPQSTVPSHPTFCTEPYKRSVGPDLVYCCHIRNADYSVEDNKLIKDVQRRPIRLEHHMRGWNIVTVGLDIGILILITLTLTLILTVMSSLLTLT